MAAIKVKMIEFCILMLLIACVAYSVNLLADRAIVTEVCPACGSTEAREVHGHVVCSKCGTVLAGCCEGGPQ